MGIGLWRQLATAATPANFPESVPLSAPNSTRGLFAVILPNVVTVQDAYASTWQQLGRRTNAGLFLLLHRRALYHDESQNPAEVMNSRSHAPHRSAKHA